MRYKTFIYHASRVHLLEVNLLEHEVRPVLAAETFPFQRIYPIKNAIEQGCLAGVGCGFNLTWYHNQGVADQPLHALVVDSEIWTTGIGGGGVGILLGDGFAFVQPNRIQVHVWGGGQSHEVESVNLKHDPRVVAFTPRGGTQDVPDPSKHLYPIGENVVESRWKLPLPPTAWKQRLGPSGIRHIVSGWPLILRAGENIVPLLELHGEASHGPDNWFIRKNPRLAVGVSEDTHTLYICTVEGRVPGSAGLRLKEMATMLQHQGVHDAVNLDGGGSAYMWTQEGGLVADSCYGDGTVDGLRPDHCSIAVF